MTAIVKSRRTLKSMWDFLPEWLQRLEAESPPEDGLRRLMETSSASLADETGCSRFLRAASDYLSQIGARHGAKAALAIHQGNDCEWKTMHLSWQYKAWSLRIAVADYFCQLEHISRTQLPATPVSRPSKLSSTADIVSRVRERKATGVVSIRRPTLFADLLDAVNVTHMAIVFDEPSFAKWCIERMLRIQQEPIFIGDLQCLAYVPFSLQLFAWWQQIDIAFDLNHSDERKYRVIYQAVLNNWSNSESFRNAMGKLCDDHLKDRLFGRTMNLFVGPPFCVFPVEIFSILRIRDDLGLEVTSELIHPLLEGRLHPIPPKVERIVDPLLRDMIVCVERIPSLAKCWE
ncbi:MAG: hypothetical protein ACKV2Q_16665 [Planctomycetaceae bacterium]